MLIDCPGGAFLISLGDLIQLDALIVVVEPYPRSAEVARRLLASLAKSGSSARVVVVANKIGQEADLKAVHRFLPEVEIEVVVPLDEAIVEADAKGLAPIDVSPTGPALAAVREVAKSLQVAGRRA